MSGRGLVAYIIAVRAAFVKTLVLAVAVFVQLDPSHKYT